MVSFEITFGNLSLQIIIIFVVTILLFIYHVTFPKNSEDLAKCNSEDCVRCSAKLRVKENAEIKFNLFIKENGCVGLSRIKRAISKANSWNILEKASKFFMESNKNSLQMPNLLYIDELTSFPFWNPDKFGYINATLTSNFYVIFNEFKNVFQTINMPNSKWSRNKIPSGNWYLYYIYNQGHRCYDDINNCPMTTSIIDMLEYYLCKSLFFNVAFSVLEENSIVPAHYGPTNARIRCHLGLSIPNDYCIINCGGESRRLCQGRCLYFDDSYFHGSKYTCATLNKADNLLNDCGNDFVANFKVKSSLINGDVSTHFVDDSNLTTKMKSQLNQMMSNDDNHHFSEDSSDKNDVTTSFKLKYNLTNADPAKLLAKKLETDFSTDLGFGKIRENNDLIINHSVSQDHRLSGGSYGTIKDEETANKLQSENLEIDFLNYSNFSKIRENEDSITSRSALQDLDFIGLSNDSDDCISDLYVDRRNKDRTDITPIKEVESLFSDNDVEGYRCVLIIDFWHPELTAIERAAITYCYPSN